MKKADKNKKKYQKEKKVSRRDFFKLSGIGLAAAVATAVIPKTSQTSTSLKGKQLGMVIDLQRCTGCGACSIACKNENNVQAGFAWAWRVSETVGKFPNVRYDYTPTLCNHCRKAPCVRICPTGAMHKADGDITMHDPNKCIGCKSCIAACPYIVISWNNKTTHNFWRSKKELIKDCTASGLEVTQKAGDEVIPYYNPDREKNLKGSGLRYKGIVEKCTLCDHRLKQGKLPYCVERCPAQARIFGDLNEPNSPVNKLLGKYKPWRLREYLGTEPKVYYVRNFNPGRNQKNKGRI